LKEIRKRFSEKDKLHFLTNVFLFPYFLQRSHFR